MTNKLEIPRLLAWRLAGLDPDYTVAQLDADEEELRALLAAPVVERQPVAIVNRKAVCFLELTEAGHLLPCGTKLYAEQPAPVAAEAAAWINPEGSKFIWASTMKDRPFNLVEYCVPLYTSMPAKAAVVYPSVDEVMKLVMNYQDHIRTNVTGTTNWAANLGMHIIDKVKELNQ